MRSALLFSIAALAVLAACQKSTRPVSAPQVGMETVPITLVGRSEVTVDGRLVGNLRRVLYEDGMGREVTFVYDDADRQRGYVLEDHRAYRFVAHGERELVASSDDLRRNVAAILGLGNTPVSIKTLASVDEAPPERVLNAGEPTAGAEDAEEDF